MAGGPFMLEDFSDELSSRFMNVMLMPLYRKIFDMSAMPIIWAITIAAIMIRTGGFPMIVCWWTIENLKRLET